MVTLKPIKDPGLKKEDPTNVGISPKIDERMKMRDLILHEKKGGTDHIIKYKTPAKDPKLSSLEWIGGKDRFLNTSKVCPLVLEAIESVDKHKFFCIGKGSNRIYCGPVIHRIPIGSYARIQSGNCFCLPSPPLNKNGSFKYEADKQLAVKVGNKVGTDYLVIVANNGCVLIDAGASASFGMPVFVVEQAGDYYKLKKGQRIFHLMTGNHLLIYTNEAPILFPRVDYKKPTISAPISVKPAEKPISPKKEETKKEKSDEKVDKKEKSVEKEDKKEKSDEKVDKKEKSVEKEDKKEKSDEKVDKKEKSDEKEDKKLEPKKPEPKKEEPKEPPKIEEPKEQLKEESKEEPMVMAETPKETSTTKDETENGSQSEGSSLPKYIGIAVAVIVGLLCIYLFFGSKGSDDKDKHKN